MRGLLGVWIPVILLAMGGCRPPRPAYPAALNAEQPADRINAIRHAADIHDRSVIGILVDRLADEDEAVRFYAILALERLTGTRLGYRYQAPQREREKAIERWREYSGPSGAAVAQTQESPP